MKKFSFALPIVFIGLIMALTIFAPIHAAHAAGAATTTLSLSDRLNLGLSNVTGAFSGITNTVKGVAGGLIDIGYYLMGKVAFFIGFIISWICGIFIGIEAWLVAVVLNINDNVFQSAIVQTGFSVSLSIANLGFVFGIIIIAIATILRSQTYGIKQILWKLVVMAILINFGLVIMGVVFNFADQFTSYFLQCIDPMGGGCSGTQAIYTSETNFASNLAGAFNPQKDLGSWNNLNASGTTASTLDSLGGVGSDVGKMFVPIFSVFFIAGALIVIIITLAAFIVMLLIRYVYIAILAVLLPFAWMLWIFPKTKGNFDRWWSAFIRWTFFAPIVLFFLWLALITAHGLTSNATGTQSFATYTSPASNPATSGLSNLSGNLITPIIQNILNEIILVGLMIGGMIAANELSITGASMAIRAMKYVGNAVGNYSLKEGKKATRATYQKVGGERVNRYLQTRKYPGVSLLGRGLATATEGGGKRLVDQDLTEARGKDSVRLATELKGYMGNEKRFAYLQVLKDRNDLDMVDKVGGKKLDEFMDGNGKTIQQYGQGKLSMDVDTAMLSNKAMRDAEREGNKETLKKSTDEFVARLDPSKVSQMNMKIAFSGNPKEPASPMTKALLESLAEKQPHLVPNMMSRMKGSERDNFTKKYSHVLEDKIDALGGKDNEKVQVFTKALKSLKDSISNQAIYGAAYQQAAAASTPPPPPKT